MKKVPTLVEVPEHPDFKLSLADAMFVHDACQLCDTGGCKNFMNFISLRNDSPFLFSALEEVAPAWVHIRVPLFRAATILDPHQVEFLSTDLIFQEVTIISDTNKLGQKVALIKVEVPALPVGGDSKYASASILAGKTYANLGAITSGMGLADIKYRILSWAEGEVQRARNSGNSIRCGSKFHAGSRNCPNPEEVGIIESSWLSFVALNGMCATCSKTLTFDSRIDIPVL